MKKKIKAGWPFSESLLAAAVSHFRWTSLSKKKWTIQGMYVYYIVNTLYHHLSFRNSRHMNVWFIPYTIYQTNPSSCPHTLRARFSERFSKAASAKSWILIQNYSLDLPRSIPWLSRIVQLSRIIQNCLELLMIIPEISINTMTNTGTALGISWGAPITPEQAKSLWQEEKLYFHPY